MSPATADGAVQWCNFLTHPALLLCDSEDHQLHERVLEKLIVA
jgi:hypothetical protein